MAPAAFVFLGHSVLYVFIRVVSVIINNLLIPVRFTEVLFYNISGMDGVACFSTTRGRGKSTDLQGGQISTNSKSFSW